VVAVLLATWIGRDGKRILRTALFAGGLALSVGSLIALNELHFGCAQVVNGGGIHLFDRVAVLEQSAPGTPEVRLLRQVNSGAGRPSCSGTTSTARSNRRDSPACERRRRRIGAGIPTTSTASRASSRPIRRASHSAAGSPDSSRCGTSSDGSGAAAGP